MRNKYPHVGFMSVCLAAAILCSCAVEPAGAGDDELIIQENSAGFVSTTGTVASNKDGYTGTGFLSNMVNGATEANIVYSVHAETACAAELSFRYAFGGTSTNYRNLYVIINGAKVMVDSDNVLDFAYTSADWTVWAETTAFAVNLAQGDNHIRVVPASGSEVPVGVRSTRIANIDRLKIAGAGLSAGGNTTVFYSLSAGVKIAGTGTVTVDPVQEFYLAGASVTLTAAPEAGYEFESWTGTNPSTSNPYTFNISSDVTLSARFLETGTEQDPDLVGYAAIQDDSGTPYKVTGGAGGSSITVSTLAELETNLESDLPCIVTVSGEIPSTPSTKIDVRSNKTIQGDGTGHLRNIELSIGGAENVIVRNLVISEVVAVSGTGNDCIGISGSKNIWIDHCEFYSATGDTDGDGDTDELDKDYYDGLIDISDGSRFITVSWNVFHDHYKAVLIGSNDTTPTDVPAAVSAGAGVE